MRSAWDGPLLRRRSASVLAVVLALAACSTYQPRSLPDAPDLITRIDSIASPGRASAFATLRTHRFDPSDGLDATEVATLAVLNSPELRTARVDAGVSRAQAFAAGLLPDPALALSRDHQLGYPAGASIAFTAGLTIDFAALLAHPASSAAADADRQKAELNLLWHEWQVIAQAHLVFAKIRSQEGVLALLERYQAVFADRWTRTRTAVQRGLLATDSVTPYLTALQDINRQVDDLRRQRNQSRHDLATLVGVDPSVELVLVGDADEEHLDDEAVRASLPRALDRRPDLAALQAGYLAEDDRYRAALIAQFPGFTFGPDRTRDTTHVDATGFALGITLPVFNRNRGNIAIEIATREKLREEYRQRLDATTVEVDRLLAEQAILERQLVGIASALTELEQVTQRAERAFQARNIDPLVLTNAQTSLLAKQIEQIVAHEALLEQRIALQTLIGIEPSARPAGTTTREAS